MTKVLEGNEELQKAMAEGVVMVDFYAEWCGPCKMVAPLLNQVAEEMADKVKIIKIDVEKEEELAKKYEVKGVPTIITLKDGVVKETKVGFVPKPHLVKMIEDAQ